MTSLRLLAQTNYNRNHRFAPRCRRSLLPVSHLVRRLLDVLHAREQCASSTEAEIEERAATDPSSGHDKREGEVHILQAVNNGLPSHAGTERGGGEEEAGLSFGLHVDGGRAGGGFLGGVVRGVTDEDTYAVAGAGGESELMVSASKPAESATMEAVCQPKPAGKIFETVTSAEVRNRLISAEGGEHSWEPIEYASFSAAVMVEWARVCVFMLVWLETSSEAAATDPASFFGFELLPIVKNETRCKEC